MKRFQPRPGIILLLVLMPVFTCISQTPARQTELLKGKKITATLKAGEKHKYTISLDKRQFVYASLIQNGIDLTIAVYDPDGKKLGEFDSPNGKNGPEPVVFNSDKKGSYVLEVYQTDKEETGGSYLLEILRTEPVGTTPEKQVDQLMAAWDNPNSPGAAIAVEKEGKILFKKGYGSANLEYNVPITPTTIFHIASVSKQFTAFSVLLLAKEGKLSLDDDIRKYIPEIQDFGKVITLRHLAHHTSGMRDQWNLLAMAGWRLDDVITKEHILKLVSREKELNFNPGDEYLYCNTGFTLLAEVVARVSGQTFAEFTRDHIFIPLKMTNTLFYDDHEKIVKNRAYSFYETPSGYKKSNLNYANVGATSLFTTVEDLCLWARNFEKPVAGDEEIIKEMNTRGILNKGDTISYALGQDIGKYKGLKFISHGGADAGYRTFLGRFPDQEFSVVVFSNFASFNTAGIALKIADIYLKDKLITPKPKEPAVAPVSEVNPLKVDEELLKSYCGQYELQPGIIVIISMEDNKLYVEAPGLPRTTLSQNSPTEFILKEMNARLAFNKDPDGAITKMLVNINGQEIIAPRVKAFSPGEVNLEEFTGEFYSPELGTTYFFVLKNGKLTASHQRLSDFVLTPVKTDFFTTDQWFFGQVEFVRDAQKNISGIKVSGGRVRNLWFKKL